MTESSIQHCIVIPVYRHFGPLAVVLDQLDRYRLRCYLVDDCNKTPLKDAIAAELSRRPHVEVLRLEIHGGKGAACVEGARLAHRHGFSHAIFIDADDQHEVADIPRVLALSLQNPTAMILGNPMFDPSAPMARRFGRIVSNMWVWLETLSFDIKDSLCGFRCLPLAPFLQIASGCQLGRRMDFDPDIAVRLFWEGVPAVNFETHIRYPPQGISNFDFLHDNVALFRLHSRLFFGMVVRSPLLLLRHWSHAP